MNILKYLLVFASAQKIQSLKIYRTVDNATAHGCRKKISNELDTAGVKKFGLRVF